MTLPRWLARLLTALALAPLTTGLAAQTAVSVNLEGWSSVWVQRGNSGVWDATWTSPNDQVSTVMEGSIRGRQIEMRRLSSSDGVLCEYRGSIGPDGRSVSGTQVCPGAAAVQWVGQLQDRGPGFPSQTDPYASAGPFNVNADGWTSTWTQRGRSGVWDAVWVQGRNRVVTVMEGGVQGDQISMRRISSSDGVLCEFRGRFGADRRSISGTQTCPGTRDVAWVGQLGDGGLVPPSVPPQPPPVQSGSRYRVENLAFQSDRGGVTSTREFLIDPRRCTVRESNPASDQGQQQIRVVICQPNRRLAFSTSVRGEVTMEYDWLFSDEGRSAVGVWRDGRGFGPSVAESGRR